MAFTLRWRSTYLSILVVSNTLISTPTWVYICLATQENDASGKAK